MSQYKPRIVEEDTRSAWEKRETGIHGHWAEQEESNAGYVSTGGEWTPVTRSELEYIGIHGTKGLRAIKDRRIRAKAIPEEETAPNPTVPHGRASGKRMQNPEGASRDVFKKR